MLSETVTPSSHSTTDESTFTAKISTNNVENHTETTTPQALDLQQNPPNKVHFYTFTLTLSFLLTMVDGFIYSTLNDG